MVDGHVKYSITASLMILCISVQLGILQLHTLLCMGFLTWVTMLLGLLTHILFEAWFIGGNVWPVLCITSSR